MRLEAVPPGADPTRTKPDIRGVLRLRRVAVRYPLRGMRVNCRKAP